MPAVVGIFVVVIFVLKREVGKGVELRPTRDFPSYGSMTLTLTEL
jgi:hypothetical protein